MPRSAAGCPNYIWTQLRTIAKLFLADDLAAGAAQAFDSVWAQFQKLSSPTKSTGLTMDDFNMAGPSEFSSPQASYTTVLVCGATGRVGRVLVRKLLLRGYQARHSCQHHAATCDQGWMLSPDPGHGLENERGVACRAPAPCPSM